jgi:hypothetical protein
MMAVVLTAPGNISSARKFPLGLKVPNALLDPIGKVPAGMFAPTKKVPAEVDQTTVALGMAGSVVVQKSVESKITADLALDVASPKVESQIFPWLA